MGHGGFAQRVMTSQPLIVLVNISQDILDTGRIGHHLLLIIIIIIIIFAPIDTHSERVQAVAAGCSSIRPVEPKVITMVNEFVKKTK